MKGGRKGGLRNSISEMEKKEEDDERRGGGGAAAEDVGPPPNRPRRRLRRSGGGGGRSGDRRKFRRVDGLVVVFAFLAAFVSMSAGKAKGEGKGREGRTRKTPFKLRNGGTNEGICGETATN